MSLTDEQLAEIFKEIKSTYPEPPYLADLISELREARGFLRDTLNDHKVIQDELFKLQEEGKRLRESLARIANASDCTACSCRCHAVACEALGKK